MTNKNYTLLDMSGISDLVHGTLEMYRPIMRPDYRMEEYLGFLVEELRGALQDQYSTSYFELAAKYLINAGIDEHLAMTLSCKALDGYLDLIGANFPHKTLLEMSRCGFVIVNYSTLAVRE